MTKYDKFLIVFLLIISASSLFLLPKIMANKNTAMNNVEIKVNGKLVKTAIVNRKSQPQYIKFKFGNATGIIETKNGMVRMLPMDKKICPQGICSKTGWIKESYQSIVCLPNKIVVSFSKSNTDVDDIVY
ncbi:MAG: NusG-II domain-containing protein [Thermoanaerobacterium thermosaccharolyticum]|uniref:NusG domain II-containing protein n=1 Tax=Thermoanaerobacterium thermosaccharolyticum TaxID=1517 RepID=UPI00211B3391|nr:NusG domain II-containing protein [Thermoanaerobacterium thermosaccharolyticum]